MASVIQDPDKTTGRLIGASKVNGTSVYDASGKKIGIVHDVMLNKMSGQAAYAVLSVGGFLGLGERYHPLPWRQLDYDAERAGFVVKASHDVLKGAPSYVTADCDTWNDEHWSRRVDEYYGGMDPMTAGRLGLFLSTS